MQASEALRNKESAQAINERLVRHIDALEWVDKGGAKWARAFGSDQGAEKLALFVLDLDPGKDQRLALGERESVLYVVTGSGTATIGDQDFNFTRGDGIYTRQNESFVLQASEPVRILLAACPAGPGAPWESQPVNAESFDREFPTRIVSADEAESENSGDRSFKVLVGPKIGSTAVTQFIGSIPRSRAPEHFHPYEEVIYVLSGAGRMWLDGKSAPVRPGSMIFLPRKQPHCMECTVPEGMKLLGMFYPAGSPAVNYKTENEE